MVDKKKIDDSLEKEGDFVSDVFGDESPKEVDADPKPRKRPVQKKVSNKCDCCAKIEHLEGTINMLRDSLMSYLNKQTAHEISPNEYFGNAPGTIEDCQSIPVPQPTIKNNELVLPTITID